MGNKTPKSWTLLQRILIPSNFTEGSKIPSIIKPRVPQIVCLAQSVSLFLAFPSAALKKTMRGVFINNTTNLKLKNRHHQYILSLAKAWNISKMILQARALPQRLCNMHLCKPLTRFQSQETIGTESNFSVFSLGSVTNQQLFVSIHVVRLPLMQQKDKSEFL